MSAQWTSSSTSTSGRRRQAPASRSVTAVCSRCRSVSGSAATGAGRSPIRAERSGKMRVSSPPALPELGAQDVRVGVPHELVERLDERAVRRPHDRVAGAVEHERALVGDLARELAHEPALARSRPRRRRARSAAPRSPRAGRAPAASASSRERPTNGDEARRKTGSGTAVVRSDYRALARHVGNSVSPGHDSGGARSVLSCDRIRAGGQQ